MIQYCMPNISLSGRVGGLRPVPTINSVEPSEPSEPSSSCSDWDAHDWEEPRGLQLRSIVNGMVHTMLYIMVYLCRSFNVLGRVPLMPCYVRGKPHPTLPNLFGDRDGAQAKVDTSRGRGNGSKLYELNLWMWRY